MLLNDSLSLKRCSFEFFSMAQEPLVSQGLLINQASRPYSGTYIHIHIHIHTHTHTLGRTSLNEWSARRRELYLKKKKQHNRQSFMSPEGFEPAIPARERQQTYTLDRAATEMLLQYRTKTLLLKNCGNYNNALPQQQKKNSFAKYYYYIYSTIATT